MNYYISDLHLFHEASIGFDGRPFRNLEEMHAEIVRKWNSKVTNGDTVYILGYEHAWKERGSDRTGGNIEREKDPDPGQS